MPTVLKMREEDYFLQEIATELGFEHKQIVKLVTRYNRKQRLGESMPKRRGQSLGTVPETKQAMRRRIKQLEREVELLRYFLQAAGRR